MADNDNPTPPATGAEGAAEQPVFRIQRVYLKDVSFESPQTPGVFVGNTAWKPNVSLQLNTETARLDNDLFECVLAVTATVSIDDQTTYLAEVKQAGLFTIRNFPEAELGKVLGIHCPTTLFPFAREEIGSLVQKGGFPQLLLDPVNFELMYRQYLQKAMQQKAQQDEQQNAPAPTTEQ